MSQLALPLLKNGLFHNLILYPTSDPTKSPKSSSGGLKNKVRVKFELCSVGLRQP